MTTKKIDSSGKYQYFPGLTVVADVFEQNIGLFQRLHDRMQESPLLTEHYALLPAESYHITSFSLFEQRKMNDAQFHSLINHCLKGTLQNVHEQLQSKTAPFSYRITSVDNRRPTLFCEIDSVAQEQQLNAAEMTPYLQKIPYKFHISLGYKYKDFDNADDNHVAIDIIRQILSKELPNYETVALNANRPKLCYFHDMTQFIPFDGSINPFISEMS